MRLDGQAWHAGEVAQVVGHDRQPPRLRDGCDEQVVRPDRGPGAFELMLEYRVMIRGRVIEREGLEQT